MWFRRFPTTEAHIARYTLSFKIIAMCGEVITRNRDMRFMYKDYRIEGGCEGCVNMAILFEIAR
jgi:hypothetical protein